MIPRNKNPNSPAFRFVTCEQCPAPRYPPEASARHLEGTVVLVVTVTEQGFAEQIGVLKSSDDGFMRPAVEAVRGWRYKPAIGVEGKPLAVRIPNRNNLQHTSIVISGMPTSNDSCTSGTPVALSRLAKAVCKYSVVNL